MRTTKEINRLIYEKMHSISTKDLFTSSGYLRMITAFVEGVTKRFKKAIKVKIAWDSSPSADIAYTDNSMIYLNAGSDIFKNITDKHLRHLGVIGLTGHEVGHCLYTDFPIMKKAKKKALTKGWYPFAPVPTSENEKVLLTEINELFEEDKDTRKLYASVLLELHNSIEDAFVENMMLLKAPRLFRQGIDVMRQCFFETTSSISEMLEHEDSKLFEVFFATLLSFAIYGYIKQSDSPSDEETEILDRLNQLKSIVLKTRYSPVCEDRYIACNQIILKIWDWLEEYKNDDDTSTDEKCKRLEDISKEVSGSSAPVGDTSSTIDLTDEDNEECEKKMEEIDRTTLLGTVAPSLGEGTTTSETYVACSSTLALEALIKETATEQVDIILEKELVEELQTEIVDIDFPSIHNGVDFIVKRMDTIPSSLIEGYARIKSEIEPLSKRLQKSIKRIFQDKRDGGKLKSLPMGKYIMSESLHREDGRIFYSKKLPVDYPELAVAVLVDESGSMGCDSRDIFAKKTALLLHDFCFHLQIPIMIVGHTETYDTSKVELYSYADFEKPDYKNQYRLMDITARENNRDGGALKFVGQRLLRRREQNKMLIIISDGQPAASGYVGLLAGEDLKRQKQELERRGVMVFAAAIGEDKPFIKQCYGEGFLDISSLEKLPMLLVSLIKKNIR